MVHGLGVGGPCRQASIDITPQAHRELRVPLLLVVSDGRGGEMRGIRPETTSLALTRDRSKGRPDPVVVVTNERRANPSFGSVHLYKRMLVSGKNKLTHLP